MSPPVAYLAARCVARSSNASRRVVARQRFASFHFPIFSSTSSSSAAARWQSSEVAASASSASPPKASMELIKALRTKSGAPIVECRKALQACNNDEKAAMDWLREHGAAKAASKVQGRETVDGLVALSVAEDGQSAALVKVAAETDFAGRSEKFVQLVTQVAAATLQAEAKHVVDDETMSDYAHIQNEVLDGKTVETMLNEAIVAIRENLSVVKAQKLTINDDEADRTNGASLWVGYVHNRLGGSDAGTAAAAVQVVSVNDAVSVDDLRAAGKKLAMHVVAARPQYLAPDDVPAHVLETERVILAKQIADSGKAAEIVDKIVQGRLRKFYESVCLLEQGHMIEEKNPKVSKVLQEQGIVLNRFELVSIS